MEGSLAAAVTHAAEHAIRGDKIKIGRAFHFDDDAIGKQEAGAAGG